MVRGNKLPDCQHLSPPIRQRRQLNGTMHSTHTYALSKPLYMVGCIDKVMHPGMVLSGMVLWRWIWYLREPHDPQLYPGFDGQAQVVSEVRTEPIEANVSHRYYKGMSKFYISVPWPSFMISFWMGCSHTLLALAQSYYSHLLRTSCFFCPFFICRLLRDNGGHFRPDFDRS